ncbi:MAG: anion permease [Gemmatimonadota bacterium]|nr:inorganic phosphate transporter [Gemmatimonadota bacterium]MDP6528821.1 anion permease [Gemmatimonadota bacterium]MDP6802375.1 anion permease [Gemmatimonadota bacterium]MDP7031111.1 anion permease [Gemmatimonadota bacterium]
MLLFFLSSGLFLGWSLGANDAANVFGTAVGTRMVRFTTAAFICSAFLIVGAVVGGAGASHTLGKLGAVNALGGAFMVALSAGFTVFAMTRLSLPVSTSQAIVGAIIGWNFFSGSPTDTGALTRIVTTWVACPLLAALFAMLFHTVFKTLFQRFPIHMLWEDMVVRWGLIGAGAFGSYSLGANNIANVMGVFVPVAPFEDLTLWGVFTLTGTQQLFLIGGVAISVGVFTYSRRVMETVGGSLLKLTPQMALIVVLSQAVVLYLFSSEGLSAWLISHGLPAIPLVPVSSSQAVIGAVLGLGILQGGRGIRYGVLGEIAAGWVTTPVIAGVVSYIALFFLQNVFAIQVMQ